MDKSRSVPHMTDRWWRRTVFLYELAALCGLLALAFAYYKVDAVTNLVPGLTGRKKPCGT